MTIPTQAQLYEEVDRRFAAEYPNAPTRLDPDDPDQAPYVMEWLRIRDELSIQWTDYVFAEFYPNAGKLDPSNPEHSTLIEYWTDIRHQICNNEGGRWSWDGQPAPVEEPLRVLAVERDDTHGGFVLVFSHPTTVDQAGDFLWPGRNALPVGVTVERRGDMAVHVRLTIESLQTMREEVAREITEAGILTAD
jgi:hypothetical protein